MSVILQVYFSKFLHYFECRNTISSLGLKPKWVLDPGIDGSALVQHDHPIRNVQVYSGLAFGHGG